MRRVILTITSTIVGMVLLLSFKTSSSASLAGRSAVVATASNPTPSSSATPGSSARTAATKTVTGTAADTRYGPVQVKVTTRNGVITSVEAVEYPENDGRDEQINSYAIPVLNQEAVAADSANIDAVSGASYTSAGYVESLQSALDQLK